MPDLSTTGLAVWQQCGSNVAEWQSAACTLSDKFTAKNWKVAKIMMIAAQPTVAVAYWKVSTTSRVDLRGTGS